MPLMRNSPNLIPGPNRRHESEAYDHWLYCISQVFFRRIIAWACSIFAAITAKAGPPYVTDDPEPVAVHNMEIYLAMTAVRDTSGWTGTAPQIEIDYGAFENTQLSLTVPMAFNAPNQETHQFGYGDTLLGVKYRFIQEHDWLPQVGIYPQLNIPTGDRLRGLGTGYADLFMPLWVQKSFGKWTAYGGGGYWINPGLENRNWWLSGIVVQRKVSSHLTLGAEIFHESPKEQNGPSATSFSVGGILEISERYHIVFSGGHSLVGPNEFQGYLGILLTFGPEREKKAIDPR